MTTYNVHKSAKCSWRQYKHYSTESGKCYFCHGKIIKTVIE